MSRHQGAASSQSLPLMGSYMRRRGVIGILFSQIDFWTHSRCLQSAPPPLAGPHIAPPSPSGIGFWPSTERPTAGTHSCCFCVLNLRPAAAVVAGLTFGPQAYWSTGWVVGGGVLLSNYDPRQAQRCLSMMGALWGPLGRLVREIVPTKAAQCQVQAESSMHSKNTTCYQFHASKCHRSNTASHTIGPLP